MLRLFLALTFALLATHLLAATAPETTIINQATVEFLDTPTGILARVQSNPVTVTVQSSSEAAFPPATIRFFENNSFANPAGSTRSGQFLFIQANAAECNHDPLLIETNRIVIVSSKTGDREEFDIVETGPNTGIFQLALNVPTRPVRSFSAQTANGFVEVDKGDLLTAELIGCRTRVVTTILIDPLGIVFDSRNNAPVAGARVTLINAATGSPAVVYQADGLTPAPNSVVTGADGRYVFPTVAPGVYRLVVVPPPGFSGPSVVSPSALPAGRVIDPVGSYGGNFPVNLATGAVELDYPLDSAAAGGTGLFVQKLASRATAELGDTVDYTVNIKNVSGGALAGVTLTDDLPFGFTYVAGSARLNKVPVADPAGNAGPRLTFAVGGIANNATVSLTYRVRVNVGALRGDGINRAQASAAGPPAVTSNVATAQVKVQEGVFTTKGVLFGKVFVDANANGTQEDGELGIPGVRLYLEDGTYAVTDSEGKYSLYGLSARTHVLKLDRTTLPRGARLGVTSTRNADDAGSLFVELKRGELHKANFAVTNATPEILEQVKARRAKAEVVSAEIERGLKERLTPDGVPIAIGDAKSLPATGIIGGGVEHRSATERTTNEVRSLPPHPGPLPPGEGTTNPAARIDGRSGSQNTLAAIPPLPAGEGRGEGERGLTNSGPQSAMSTLPNFTSLLPAGTLNSANSSLPVARGSASHGSAGGAELRATADVARSSASHGSASGAELRATADVARSSASHGSAGGAELRATSFVPLEQSVTNFDNSLGFLDLKDRDTLPLAQANVRIKGAHGAAFTLKVNGVEVPKSQLGKTVVVAEKQLEAREFIGITLKPGTNTLELIQADSFGNARGSKTIRVIAPDKLGKIQILLPKTEQPADRVTPAKISVKLTDANGVPVTARTPLTLEASLGRWQVDDLDKNEPGTQVFIEGGSADFYLLPPSEPGDAHLVVSSGVLKDEATLPFLPDLRPLLAVGVIEGSLNISHLSANSLVPARSKDGFEEELREFAVSSRDGKTSAGGRAAFFIKGKIKGDYLLTAGFDSEKAQRERLFRDIQPDEFYPVYGDSSVRGYDAQSTGKLYVRVDKKRSYLLYGDFTTATPSETRSLGNYNRSLTGFKEHYEKNRLSLNVWASQDSARQVIEELPANGTSGPYLFRNADGIANSERVEILTRDRNQPSLILKTVPMTRFSDYEFEPFTGRILFKAPVPSLDANLNPISIRVTFEVDQGGEKFWVYGTDGQVKVNDRLEVGGSAVRDENPRGHYELYSGNTMLKLADKTFLIGEVAQSTKEGVGTGNAGRVELRHQSDGTDARLYYGKAGGNFDNPAAVLGKGRVEAGAKVSQKITDNTRVIGQALLTEDVATHGERKGVRVDVERTFANNVRLELGARHSEETAAPASVSTAGVTPNDVTSLRAKVSAPVPRVPGAQLYGEYENDVFKPDNRVAAVGGEYQLANRGRLYARHEFISALGGPFELNAVQQRNTTVVGMDTEYMKDGQMFNEYRARDAFGGREAEAATGLRNQWNVAEGVRLHTTFERVSPMGGQNNQNESTAATGAIEYTRNPDWKGTARLELRTSTQNDSLLHTLGYARKLDRDWTFLGRAILSLVDNKSPGAGDKIQGRLQSGLAFRQTETDVWSGLLKHEYKYEDDASQPGIALRRHVNTLSCDANYQPVREWIFSGHYAGKLVTESGAGSAGFYHAHLLGGRATYELTSRWDVGLNGSTLFSGNGRSVQFGVGPEVGYTLKKNLRIAVGYNVFGFRERDLAEDGSTQRGLVISLKFKFDEALFGKRKEN